MKLRQQDAHTLEREISLRMQCALDLAGPFLDRRQVVQRLAKAGDPMDGSAPICKA
jgi:hypothetical protein